MSRPGFALSVLLVTFSGLLFAVRAANSQQPDARVGGVKFGLCPFLGDELYDGGFGAHVCDVGYRPTSEPTTSPAPVTQRPSYWPLTSCCVNEWLGAIPARIRASMSPESLPTSYLSGYDAAYDKAVYGVESKVVPTVRSGNSKQSSTSALKCPLCSDWAAWDWCEGECGGCVKPAPAKAVTAATKPMEREPSSIEDYYSMYGGDRRPAKDYSMYEDNYGYAPAGIEKTSITKIVQQWMSGCTLKSIWESIQYEYASRRECLVHRLMVSQYWPTIAKIYRTWNYEIAVSSRGRVAGGGADRGCGGLAVLAVARSLDQAGSMLQNASRRLKQMVENPAVEVSTTSDTSDQR